MQIVSNIKGERSFVINPTLVITINKGNNHITPEVARLIDNQMKNLMEEMGLEIIEEVKVEVKTVETPEQTSKPDKPVNILDMSWQNAVKAVNECNDLEYLESLLETETRQSVIKAIKNKVS